MKSYLNNNYLDKSYSWFWLYNWNTGGFCELSYCSIEVSICEGSRNEKSFQWGMPWKVTPLINYLTVTSFRQTYLINKITISTNHILKFGYKIETQGFYELSYCSIEVSIFEGSPNEKGFQWGKSWRVTSLMNYLIVTSIT